MANDRPYYKGNNPNWNNNNQNRNNQGNYRNNQGNQRDGNDKGEITQISAPFNFVPLNDSVVSPEWASRISHDMPLSDGISGTISLRLTAQSPIFVRNGHTRTDADKGSDVYNSFSRIGDRFFLPGTTVKGAVRSVLEVLSFGKMRLDKRARFAQREWYNKNLYTLKGNQQSVRCGWLTETSDGNYEITDCGTPYRISQSAIGKYLTTLAGNDVTDIFTSRFSIDNKFFNINRPQTIPNRGKETYDPKTAMFKYKLTETICKLDKLHNLRFSKTEYDEKKVYVNKNGNIRGSIVMTGQPDKRGLKYDKKKDKKIWSGKFFEFVFPDPAGKPRTLPLTRDEFEQYKFIYADSPDWKFMNERMLDKRGIPVFFRIDKSTGSLLDWGLAFLYKLPYLDTPYSTLPDAHKSEEMDMADCIFGRCSDNASLRGRVQFSTFFCDNMKYDARKTRNSRVTLTLGEPKASYYPIYIEQGIGKSGKLDKNESYLTYNDGYIRGRKRYLRRTDLWGKKSQDSAQVDTNIFPLDKGAEFTGQINFHNLKPEELGALLSALTFHGDEMACHLIGMAKPYGYGKVKLDITDIDLHKVGTTDVLTGDCQRVAKGYMKKFEDYMDSKIGKWLQTPAIKELLCMAKEDVANSPEFQYMTLDVKSHSNDFEAAKKAKLCLQPFSAIRKK